MTQPVHEDVLDDIVNAALDVGDAGKQFFNPRNWPRPMRRVYAATFVVSMPLLKITVFLLTVVYVMLTALFCSTAIVIWLADLTRRKSGVSLRNAIELWRL